MPDNINELRQRLLEAQEMTPSLHNAYQKELDAMFHPPLTPKKALPGIGLLIVLLVCIVGIARAIVAYHPGPLMTSGYLALAAAFSYASFLIVRDLWHGTHSQKAVSSIAGSLTLAAGVITVVALLLGLREPSDPKSTFGALYVFVFYVACLGWSLDSRIATAELSAREQMLRIECRLADLAEKMRK